VEESGYSIFCLQETKMAQVNMSVIRKLAPRRFDSFDFIPSMGASGGILIAWCSSLFTGWTLEKT
jgi:hypothetical protein